MTDNNILNTITKITFGTDSGLSDDSRKLSNLTTKVTENSIKKYNSQVPDNDLFGYTQQLGFTSFFKALATENNKLDHNVLKTKNNEFTEKMVELGSSNALLLHAGDNDRLMAYDNYDAMVRLIPICSMALDTYVANIISPDDFTKRIFNVKYNDDTKKNMLEPVVKECIRKYDLEAKVTEIVKDSLKLGRKYIAVLQYTDEFNKMLSDTTQVKPLNETLNDMDMLDEAYVAHVHNTEPKEYNFNFSKDEKLILESYLDINFNADNTLTESLNDLKENNTIITELCRVLNENVKIGSSYDSLKPRFELETTMKELAKSRADKFNETNRPKLGERRKKAEKEEADSDRLAINGSALRYLDASRIVKLEIDNICYGYYYIEYDDTEIARFNGTLPSSLYQNMPGVPVVKNDVQSSDSGTKNKPESKIMNVSDEMYDFISSVFLTGISNKLNKHFLANNKQLKDIIYSLVRQKYIKEKPIKITYFKPEEIIEFAPGSIFENAVYIAKIYLATLTNDIIIKLGRGHDKRIFYVSTGIAKDYEAAIQKTVEDIKSKDIGFNSLGSINSALSLSSGRFDDYYVPILPDGTKAVQIDAIAGANTDEDTELLEYLRKELINIVKLPAAYIADYSENIEFARNISAQNAEFLRLTISYQLVYNKAFTQLLRTLVRNELMYSKNGINDQSMYDASSIEVSFPSPGALQMTNLMEQTNNASAIGDFFVMMYGHLSDPNNVKINEIYKGKVMRKMLGDMVDWNEFEELYNEAKREVISEKITDKAHGIDDNIAGGYGGGY